MVAEAVCRGSFAYIEESERPAYFKAAREAVTRVRAPDLAEVRQACLRELERAW
jgi:hypothetical protein